MKLADLSTGPDWVVYVGFIIFAVLSIVLISGHGSWLISGYNTASKEEKAKYNEKKLCRTMGIGMSVIAILLLIMGVFENILPAFFVYIALGIILADVVIIIATEVSRFTRSTLQLCEIIEFVKKNHIKLVLGTFEVDCSKELDPMTEGMLKMMGVFAELERNMISQRVKSR